MSILRNVWIAATIFGAPAALSAGGIVSAGIPDAAWLAGNEIGNGGDAVICQTPHPEMGGRTAMLLDLYEASSRWHLTPDLGPASGDLVAKATLVFDRLEHLDPDRHARYLANLATFWTEANLAANLSLPTIPDAGAVVLPGPDCQVVQLAFQQPPQLPNDYRYYIRKEVWDQLDDDSRADLIVHEIIYREAIEQGQENSRSSRYFNANIVGNALTTEDAYCDLLEAYVKAPPVRQLQGGIFALRTLKVDRNDAPLSGTIYQYSTIRTKTVAVNATAGNGATFFPNGFVATMAALVDDGLVVDFGPNSNCGPSSGAVSLAFDTGGFLRTVFKGEGELNIRFCPPGGIAYDVSFTDDVLNVQDTGVVAGGTALATFVPVACGSLIKAAGPVTFYPNGKIQTAKLEEDAAGLCLPDNKSISYCNAGAELKFDIFGFLIGYSASECSKPQ